jgi:hypothetical protein
VKFEKYLLHRDTSWLSSYPPPLFSGLQQGYMPITARVMVTGGNKFKGTD